MFLTGMVILALFAAGLLVVLVKAFGQNRELWRKLQASGRSRRELLKDALLLWSPLGLVILVLAFAANRITAAAIGLTYRITTLDEFCSVRDVPGDFVLPCTGMHGQLPRSAVRPVGVQGDLEHFLGARYRAARQQLLDLSPEGLRAMAGNRPAFDRALSPGGVLGLEAAPEADSELVRLKRELQALISTPATPANGLFDMVRFVNDRDARVRRLRQLTAMVVARRELVNERAYAGLPRAEQGRLWMRHRLSRLASSAAPQLDTATAAALGRLVADPGSGAEAVDAVRRGVLLMLARHESVVAEALSREAATPAGRSTIYLALPVTRLCTVESPEDRLRWSTADFSRERFAVRDFDRLTQSNNGAFDCSSIAPGPARLRLKSLGFRESVRRSIERWHAQSLDSGFRRLGSLSLDAGLASAEGSALARSLADAVPGGISLGRADCAWTRPGSCAGNAARAALEQGAARARDQVVQSYEREADAALGVAAQSLDERIGRQLLVLDRDLERVREDAKAFSARMFLFGDLTRLLGWLAVALVAVKSFLYVLALELFHTEQRMTIGFDDASRVEGEFRASRRLTIDRDFPHALITRKQLSNTDNNVCLAPWPWSSPISRIFHRRYFIFTRGSFLADADPAHDPGQAARGMVVSAGSGLSIVEWKMRQGEEVIFRYKDFYGASENVRLGSEISFRLSTLLLGRVIFHIARCPEGEGRLLLKANVEEIEQADVRAMPPERMLAWNRHARFTIHSGRTLWKTLLNGYTLVRDASAGGPSGRVLVSSDDAGSNLGSIRYLKRIFTAIF